MSRKALQIIFGVFLFSLAYSVVRYHVVGDVGSRVFPFYIANKCLALTGFILLAINFTLGPAKALGGEVQDPWLSARKEIGIVSFMLILACLQFRAANLSGVMSLHGTKEPHPAPTLLARERPLGHC